MDDISASNPALVQELQKILADEFGDIQAIDKEVNEFPDVVARYNVLSTQWWLVRVLWPSCGGSVVLKERLNDSIHGVFVPT